MASHSTSKSVPLKSCSLRLTKVLANSVDKTYNFRNPPLTVTGELQARSVRLSASPDLIIVSPMTRTIQTTRLAFREVLSSNVRIEIWPDLREAHDAVCNKGVSRSDMMATYPDLDFSQCPEEWEYPPHSFKDAAIRAERVRQRAKAIADMGGYRNIYLVTHRGFITFLVQGPRFVVCGKFPGPSSKEPH